MRTTVRRRAWALAVLCSLGPAASVGAEERSYKVIVNAGNPISDMRKDQVAQLFLNRNARWTQVGQAAPVDQSMSSPVREAFSTEVLGQTLQAVQAYWQKKILAEREMPPPVKSSDDEVVAHVAKNKGGIGYVAAAATLPASVKVLRVE